MSKGEQTRSAVLKAALSLASAEGLEGLSIGRLAKAVGMSKSGLFAHFKSKDQLQVDVLEEAIERFTDVVVRPAVKAARGEPRVRALYERWLGWKDELPGGCIFIAAAVDLDDRPGPARDRLVQSQNDWLATLAKAASIAIEEGHFRTDLDPKQFAFEMIGITYSFHFVSKLLERPTARRQADDAFERLLSDARPPDSRPPESSGFRSS